ncbi:fluoride efflux transporter CrcB [Neobacillus sp. D3-1R]|uniref:fluoride efflux transporter CrcB n=1 Tax=Neobacillus sp. D3-1R TaxID=3445778 RepID=UPI003FA0E5B8
MLFAGIGGIFGAITRFLLGKWISSKTSNVLPFGTWVINLTGSFVLGLLAFLHQGLFMPNWVWLLCGTGFLGAYTTFSTFGYETLQMIENKVYKKALFYVSSSVVLGVLFAGIGWVLAEWMM